MPSGGTRSRNGSCCGGTARCTASTTLSYCCGPVTASTPGCAAVIFAGSAPMQQVRTTLPFSATALPVVAVGAQPGDDALAMDQRLRSTERNERNASCAERLVHCRYCGFYPGPSA